MALKRRCLKLLIFLRLLTIVLSDDDRGRVSGGISTGNRHIETDHSAEKHSIDSKPPKEVHCGSADGFVLSLNADHPRIKVESLEKSVCSTVNNGGGGLGGRSGGANDHENGKGSNEKHDGREDDNKSGRKNKKCYFWKCLDCKPKPPKTCKRNSKEGVDHENSKEKDRDGHRRTDSSDEDRNGHRNENSRDRDATRRSSEDDKNKSGRDRNDDHGERHDRKKRDDERRDRGGNSKRGDREKDRSDDDKERNSNENSDDHDDRDKDEDAHGNDHSSKERTPHHYVKVECERIGPCILSLWGAWGTCTVSCGGGTQIRTRELLQAPACGKGAAQCAALPLNQTQACNTQCCPQDCQVSAWSVGACTATCGPGTQTLTRTITVPQACGGAACPALQSSQPCDLGPCPPCPAGWFHSPPYCYLDTQQLHDYAGAKAVCASIGAHLPIFRSVAEWNSALAWAGPNQHTSFWVGLTDFPSGCGCGASPFYWDDGTSAAIFPGHVYPWETTDPDGLPSWPTCNCAGQVHCVRAEIQHSFGWMDDNCNPPNGWDTVCQINEYSQLG